MVKSEFPSVARKMLDYLIATPANTRDDCFVKSYLPANSHIGYPDGERAVRFLLENGFISEPEPDRVRLELKGSCYKELLRATAVRSWADRLISLAIGIVLGVGTTLLTSWLAITLPWL